MQAEEPLYRILGNSHEQLAAALGEDVTPKGVLVDGGPFFEAVERVLALKQQVVGGGQDLPVLMLGSIVSNPQIRL